jgi:predicted CoA-binding protein
MSAAWEDLLLTHSDQLDSLLARTRRVAVLGIRSERVGHRAAHYVPAYLASAGLEVIPVPVYEPDVTHILGQPVYRRVSDIPGPVDLVDVFRRGEDIPPHLPDLLAKRPAAVWFQSGIVNDAAAEVLAKAGILVVQDRRLMVEHRRWASSPAGRG